MYSNIPEGLNQKISEYLGLLPSRGMVFPRDAEERAGEILKFTAYLNYLKFNISNIKVEANSIAIATYHQLYQKTQFPEKAGVNEKKATVEANPEYMEAFNKVEVCDNEIKYIAGMIDIFNNGHLTLRQMAKSV